MTLKIEQAKQGHNQSERTETATYCSCRRGSCCRPERFSVVADDLLGGYGWRQNLLETDSLLHKNEGAFRSVRCEVFGEFCPISKSRSSQTSQGRAGRANLARRPSSSASHKRPTRQSIECAPSLILAVALYRTCQTIRCADHKFHSFAPLTFFAVGGREKGSQQYYNSVIWKKSNTSRADLVSTIHRLLSRARVTDQILDRRAIHHKSTVTRFLGANIFSNNRQ